MSMRNYMDIFEALNEASARGNRSNISNSPMSALINRMREAQSNRPSAPSRPSRSSDFMHESYMEERDYGYGDRRRDRGRGHSSRQRHPMDEMRMGRECGYDPYEEEFDHYHTRRSNREKRYSPERWKKATSPPPTPSFRIRRGRQYINIMDLFNPSERDNREKGVAIFIRGAPSSGKTILAKLIMEKEQSLGNRKIVYLTVNGYYQNPPGSPMMTIYRENMRKLADEEFTKRSSKFYVVEVDGGPIAEFEKLYNLAIEKANVTCYLIECSQTADTCLRYLNIRAEEMKEVVRLIEEEAPKEDVLLIDADKLYKRNWRKERMVELMNKSVESRDYTSAAHKVPTKLEKLDNPYARMKVTDDFTDLATHVAELMKDPDILKLIEKSMAEISLRDRPDTSKTLEKTTTVTPKSCFDYNHKPIITDEDVLFNVQPLTVIDYNHRTSKRLAEIVEGVDVDGVIAKHKLVNLREKMLSNFALADVPEELESTSSYPNNWVVISGYKTNPINKTKKENNKRNARRLKEIEDKISMRRKLKLEKESMMKIQEQIEQ